MLSWILYFWILLLFMPSIRFYSFSIAKPNENKCFPEFFISEFSFFSHRQFAVIHRSILKTMRKQVLSLILYFWILILFASSIRCYSPFHIKSNAKTSAVINSLFLNSHSFRIVNSLLFTVHIKHHVKTSAVINSLVLNSPSVHIVNSLLLMHRSISKPFENKCCH